MFMATVAKGITCPSCSDSSRVITTDTNPDQIVRDRICRNPDCHEVFTSIEDPMGSEPADEPSPEHHRGMPCPECGGNTTVKQTRRAADQVRRRRHCLDCDHTFKTKERLQR